MRDKLEERGGGGGKLLWKKILFFFFFGCVFFFFFFFCADEREIDILVVDVKEGGILVRRGDWREWAGGDGIGREWL